MNTQADTKEDSQQSAGNQGRYRALLRISSTVASQPTVETVLSSIANLLSNVLRFEGVGLLLFDPERQKLTLRAMEMGSDLRRVNIGTEIPYIGTPVERAIEEQVAIFVSDLSQEQWMTRELSSRFNPAGFRSALIFPLATARHKLGALVFGTLEQGEFTFEEVEFMRSAAQHVSVALESALATEAAEGYQRELAHERDRLRLLLEINNHVVSKLDVRELFHAASASLRRYFCNEFTSFWLFDEHSSRAKCALLDFPGSHGFLGELDVAEISEDLLERLRTRTPKVEDASDFVKLPAPFGEAMKAESIVSTVMMPLVTTAGPIGLMALGSRRENCFGQADLDLLSQIGGQIALALDNALAYGRLRASHDRLEDERLYLESEIVSEFNFEDIVGKSRALKKVLEQVSIVAPTDSTVLLHGETGTGKELIARAIHNLSSRAERTFVRLNCASIPSGLVESELFGHEKGAFTGALMQKRGRFELADRGSLFLDEIGDINLELQPKLLRALQEQEFERLGSTKTVRVDIRLIAATHRDLPSMIRDGQFREDLFYRLNVFPIEIPPLRERREDIPLLVHYFVSKLSRRMRKSIKTIPKSTMNALTNYPWKGNVRELENLMERSVILTQGEDLNVPVAELQNVSVRNSSAVSTFHQAERKTILEALRAAAGQISGKGGAAEQLGLKRTTLQNKMRRLGITKKDY